MLAREEEVEAHALRAQGWSVSAIARHLDRDRKTVRAYLSGERTPGVRRSVGEDPFARFEPYTRQRLKDDPHLQLRTLLRELEPLGFSGTVLVKDVFRGSSGSYPSSLTDVGGTLYFVADDGSHGYELWKSDGTSAGTVLVKDIAPGSAGSGPDWLMDVNGTLYFNADDGVHGDELWKSDGTGAGTVMVKDINP